VSACPYPHRPLPACCSAEAGDGGLLPVSTSPNGRQFDTPHMQRMGVLMLASVTEPGASSFFLCCRGGHL
jgi:hypothetical protein